MIGRGDATWSRSGSAVRAINDSNPTLQELADEIAALSVQAGGSARQNAIAAQLMMLTQRMAKNANTMLAEAQVDPEVAFLLGKDTNTFRDIAAGPAAGQRGAAHRARRATPSCAASSASCRSGVQGVPAAR